MGVDLEMMASEATKKHSAQEVTCPLCTLPFRAPFSGHCGHPACKSCWVVYFTRNLRNFEDIQCPVCQAHVDLHQVKPDQKAQKRLEKYKNTRCKNCSWRGSYTEYIKNHERICGDIIRIQCNVLGCEKWLPKDKALELHRHDEWCPMILLMKTRLSHAEIVHLSMRESWEWTCGLVMRSSKPAVCDVIERLVKVFSHLDPNMRIALQNDVYGATAEVVTDTMYSCDSRGIDSKNELPNGKIQNGTVIAGLQGHPYCPEANGSNLNEESAVKPRTRLLNDLSSPSSATFNDNQIESFPMNMEGVRSSVKEAVVVALEGKLKEADRKIKNTEKEIEDIKRTSEINNKVLEELKPMPKAVAALDAKSGVLEGVMATLNKEIGVMNTRVTNLQAPQSLPDKRTTQKLERDIVDINRKITSVSQELYKLQIRLNEQECSKSGVFIWKVSNYTQKKREAQTTSTKSIYSVPFFTSQYGYKLCGRVFLVGDGVGKGTHLSLFLTIMKGPYDAVLPWPFKEKITFTLVNQNDPVNKSVVEAFRPDPASSSFKRPTSERNIGAGCPLFAKIQTIEDPKQGFLKEDTLYIKIISQTSDLPEAR